MDHDWTRVGTDIVKCLRCHDLGELGKAVGNGCRGYYCDECGEIYVSPCQRHSSFALDTKQVGGSHYQTGDHEPFLVIDEWSEAWPKETVFFLGNAVKYVSRLGRKSQTAEAMREDLDKSIHYLQEARKRI